MNMVPDREEDDVLAMQEISLDDPAPPPPPPPPPEPVAPDDAHTNDAIPPITHQPPPPPASAEADLERAMGGPAAPPAAAPATKKFEEFDDFDQSADEAKKKAPGDEEQGEADDVERVPERWRLGQELGLTKIGALFWVMVLVIPNVFILLLLLIPLGDPYTVFDRHGAWPFIFFVNPLIMALVAYLQLTPYWGAHGDERPFTLFPEKLPIMAAVYVLELVVILALVLLFDFFSFIGLVSLGISFLIAFFGTWVWQRLNRNEALLVLYRKYMKIVALLYIHLIILAIYVILFRELPANLQSVLTFALSIVVFINRKIMLSFTDPFPIELAMLISGFWINNVSDMFQTLAFPNVKDPITFLYIWIINFVGDVANLIFLTSVLRVWIKAVQCFLVIITITIVIFIIIKVFGLAYLVWQVLQGKCRRMPKPDFEDTNPNERGHSNNRPGYRRRQARFYFWRITSKLVAIAFYLTVSLVLRYYDTNNQYFNFSNDPYTVITSSEGKHPNVLSGSDYANSIIYVSCNFVVTLLAGLMGYALLRWHWRGVFQQLAPIARTLAHNHTFIGFIAAIIAHNGLLAIVFLQYHQRIWWYDLSFI